MALVSVIVPAFNAARTLSETLDSIRAQDWSDLEVVVVDDGSSDMTAEIARQHAARDTRIRVVSQPNRGVSAARNRGIEISRGAYVAPCDADDLWHPQKIGLMVRRMEELGPETGYVYSLSHMIDDGDRIFDRMGVEGHEGAVYLRSLFLNLVGNGSSILLRREALDSVGGYDTRLEFWEDLHLQAMIARHWKVGCVPQFLTGYRSTGHGASADELQMYLNVFKALQLVFETYPDTPRRIRDASMAVWLVRLAMKQLSLLRLGAAAASLARAMRLSPRITLEVACRILTHRIPRLVRKRLGPRRTAEPGPLFSEADPADIIRKMGRSTLGRRRSARLARLDDDFFSRVSDRNPAKPARRARTGSSLDGCAAWWILASSICVI